MTTNNNATATAKLVKTAIKAAANAYAPYSNYPVGAALKAAAMVMSTSVTANRA